MTIYLFPGQGTQYPGMGAEWYKNHVSVRRLFNQADKILGFSLTEAMFDGSTQTLLNTQIAQPAIFLYSMAQMTLKSQLAPDAVAGHSLGELSALTAAEVFSFEEGLWLVQQRARAMQAACVHHSGTMAAVLGLEDAVVERICQAVEGDFVVPANYNAPGQVVISGTLEGVRRASEALQKAGAKKVIPLQVGGGFHSALMHPAQQKIKDAVMQLRFRTPKCPIYQNVSGVAETSPERIRTHLIAQVTAPVRWMTMVQNMIREGVDRFVECGPGCVLQRLLRSIAPEMKTATWSL